MQIGFSCVICGKNYKKNYGFLCSCGGNLQVEYDFKKINRDFFKRNKNYSMWRYEKFLPVAKPEFTPHVGWTPLYKFDKLSNLIGVKELFIKDDSKNPSLSLKDRASLIAILHAKNKGKIIVSASTGNAGSSIALMGAFFDIKNVILVPQNAPVAKLTQMMVFGSKLICVDGTYDDAYDLSIKASETLGLYCRNTGYNPFTREGKKTVAFEICENLNFKVPDFIVVPVGDGNIISGIWKGFKEFYKLNLIDRLPRLIAVQAEKSNAIIKAYESNNVISKVEGTTLADSISVSMPRDGFAAINALKESNAISVSVKDKDIISSELELARLTGIFAEPAASATLAGLKKVKEKNLIQSTDSILILITGNGLKDVGSVHKVLKKPPLITNISEFKKVMKEFVHE